DFEFARLPAWLAVVLPEVLRLVLPIVLRVVLVLFAPVLLLPGLSPRLLSIPAAAREQQGHHHRAENHPAHRHNSRSLKKVRMRPRRRGRGYPVLTGALRSAASVPGAASAACRPGGWRRPGRPGRGR